MLSHYTKSIDALLSILSNGLIYFPNYKNVFASLTSPGASTENEPQCRGMISFTDIPFEHSEKHRESYGRFGLLVDRDWAVNNGACKVIYVGNAGSVYENFRELFLTLVPEVETSGNAHLDLWLNKLASTKPEFANSLGGAAYSHLLELHQYMQSDEEVAESEWRIIRATRFTWSEGMDINDVKTLCLNAALAGRFPTLKISPECVRGIICPAESKDNLINALPDQWRSVDVLAH